MEKISTEYLLAEDEIEDLKTYLINKGFKIRKAGNRRKYRIYRRIGDSAAGMGSIEWPFLRVYGGNELENALEGYMKFRSRLGKS